MEFLSPEVYCTRTQHGASGESSNLRPFNHFDTVKPVLSGHSKKKTKIGFQDRLSLNAGQKFCRMLREEHSAILSTFIKLSFAFKTFVFSIFEWPLIFEWPSSEFANNLGPDQTDQWLPYIIRFLGCKKRTFQFSS